MPTASTSKGHYLYLADVADNPKKRQRVLPNEPLSDTTSNSRIKAPRACLYCKRSHMTCENKRPCWRCVKRGIASKCITGNADWEEEGSALPGQVDGTTTAISVSSASSSSSSSSSSSLSLLTSQLPPAKEMEQEQAADSFGYKGQHVDGSILQHQNSLHDLAHLYSNPMRGSTNQLILEEERRHNSQIGETFLQLNWGNFDDLVSSSGWNIDHSAAAQSDSSLQKRKAMERETGRGAIVSKETGTTTVASAFQWREEKKRPYDHLVNQPLVENEVLEDLDGRPLRPYDYSYSFRRVRRWSRSPSAKWTKPSIDRVDNVLQLMQTTWDILSTDLSDIQLIQQERCFLDIVNYYQRYVLDAVSLPMCLFRRVGEIYCVNDAWTSTMGVSRDVFRDGRVCLYQLLEESLSVVLFEAVGKRLTGQESTMSFSHSGKLSSTGEILSPCQVSPDKQVQVTFEIVNDKCNVPLVIIAMLVPLAADSSADS